MCLQVTAVNILTCQDAADVEGFSSGTVITVEVCCDAPPPCGPGTYENTTPLLYYGSGSTCADVDSMISAGTGCGYHCYKVSSFR